jgi:hypothetical protein
MSVIALLAPKIDGTEDQVGILSGIDFIPEEILKFIQNKVPTFKLRYSKMAGKKYYLSWTVVCTTRDLTY